MADLSPGLGMISTRTSRSSMSSSINPLPLMRRTSDSSAPSTPSTPSSVPSFRAIRNLLPFGNSKPASPAQPPTQTKHPFHFASLRRSSDRKPSFSSARDHQRDQDNPPVISISRLDAEEFGAHKRSYDLVRVASASDSLLPSLSTASQSLDDEMYVPIHPCPADLSTILEAENSGISKYIPSASPSPSPSPTSPHTFFPSKVTFSPPPSHGTFPIPKDRSASQTYCGPSPTASNLDLSLSNLSAELHDALSPTTADGWSSVIVVEDADVAPPPSGTNHGFDSGGSTSCLPQISDPDPDATFDFSALDPDLAELLSPHRAPRKETGESATDKLAPGRFSIGPYRVAASTVPQTPGPRLYSAPLTERSTTPLSSGCSSVEPLPREPITPLSPSIRSSTVPQLDARSLVSLGSRTSQGVVHSPEPTQLPISRPSMDMRRSPSHLPRLVRSVTSASPSIAVSTPGTSVETATRTQRHQLPSPLSAGQVTADTVMRSTSDTTGLRVSLDTCVPRPSVNVSFMPRSSSDTGSKNTCAIQHPKQQGHVSSCPNGNVVPTRGAPPLVPCITTALVPTSTAPPSLSASPSTAVTSSPSTTTTSTNPRTPTSSPPPTTSTPHDPAHIRRRHHPHLFISRKRSLSVDEPSSLSTRVENSGSSASNHLNSARRFGLGVNNGVGERAGRVKLASGENRLVSSPLTRSTHIPGPPIMEWLGPRTAKAFAAAGLFDGEREEAGARFERERAGARVNRFEQDREGASSVLSRFDRDREGATSVMSRLDRDRETSLGRYDRDRDYSTINRYTSLRDHAPSRAAFSEAASTSSFGTRSACTTGNAGTGWSPSPTFSSAARTAFSGSTAPTSVSSGVGSGISAGAGAGVGNAGVGNAMGANVRTLQEKHCLETSALLNALADSQEACRRLREENGVLRERLRVLEAMVKQDRDDVGLGRGVGLSVLSQDEEDGSDKTHRYDQDFERLPRKHFASLRVSPAHQSRTLTPVPRMPHLERSHSHLLQHDRHHTVSAKASFDFTSGRTPSPSRSTQFRLPSQQTQSQPTSSLSIQPPSPQKRHPERQRRASTSSSLFPAPPPEMSMLMLEDVGLSNVVSESPPSPGGSSPVVKKLGHKHSHSHSMIPRSHSFYAPQSSYASQSVSFTSFASTGTAAASPSTATFSMTEAPGSPHSLQLRPEHELHLGDMASLSLYAMSDGEGDDGDEEV
ncbi:uncharacterized protein BJ212DRAFT_1484704 [Suillus subaureus]|uniref:Uncharacterized protein n=1 Tax=Suillus subaureus TaxID=48587 RepID=A0A9P7E1Y8_9AGAM|nr:uncharacterized protein BJ212DRAFT_1484704 [Suillus subaureus]KAG1809202.1 hypothetical protein BJ212DRAFT_1484704 [Suillus subaureus]